MEKRQRTAKGEWAVLAFFTAIAALVFEQIATSLAAQNAASGDPLQNAALFPRLIAVLMLVLLGLVAIPAAFGRLRSSEAPGPDALVPPPETGAQRLRMILGIVVALFAYLLAFEPLGFHLATTAAIGAMFAILGVRPWWRALLAGLAVDLLVGVIFEVMLKVVLPPGIFNITLSAHTFGF